MTLLTSNPLTQLAFSVYENKGVFALLLGSGLSRAADIPTGWEITLDLIRRVALAEGQNIRPDWSEWYRAKTGEEPSYSALLQELGLSQEQRRSILHSYIDPTDEDRREGRKVPTKAHLAIADLVQAGFIKVIITTNFDRLMENAISDRGIEPTIVSSTDALAGAEPITHSACYLLKLHGDYKDFRILNTDDELSTYPEVFDRFLDRIFDEYGLIVTGWSGEWDQALRAAMLRAPNRRYPVYWAARGALRPGAQELVDHRRAKVILVRDADDFFTDLSERIETLRQTHRQNPLSTELLVNSIKRYVAKPEHRVQLHDTFTDEVERVLCSISVPQLDAAGVWSPDEFRNRVQLYQAAMEPLARMAGVLGRWGDNTELPLIIDCLRSLYGHSEKSPGGLVTWLNLRSYPAVLLFTAYALALVRAERWQALCKICETHIAREDGASRRVIDQLFLWNWQGYEKQRWQLFPGLERTRTPFSDHLLNVFSEWSKSFAGLVPNFELLFERFEMLGALADLQATPELQLRERLKPPDGTARTPVGRIGWDWRTREILLEEISNEDLKRALTGAGFGQGTTNYIDLFVLNLCRISERMSWS